MPLYDYTCQKCEHTFETLIFNDTETVECPQCQSRKVDRQMSLPARPLTETKPLPAACNSSGPPCGSMCSRFRE